MLVHQRVNIVDWFTTLAPKQLLQSAAKLILNAAVDMWINRVAELESCTVKVPVLRQTKTRVQQNALFADDLPSEQM